MPTSTTMQGLTTGLCSDHDHSSVIPPAFLFSNYFYDTSGECPPFDYGRGGNPTRALLADALTTLEGSAGAVVTSSGMSAVILVLQAFVPMAATSSLRTTVTAAPDASLTRGPPLVV